MAVSSYKIKKWFNMITGNSVHHVNQDEGRVYSVDKIEGYYNNLTEKITRFGRGDNSYPKSYVDTGEEIEFSIGIFQYGLAAYDLYLMSGKKDNDSLAKVLSCADWGLYNQLSDGSWITFKYENPDSPFSSMAQGEGISLLVRAYIETCEKKYLDAALRAKHFMLTPVENGGTTKYIGDNVYFYECPADPLILNGWIFSLWGIFDLYKLTRDTELKKIMDRTLLTLERDLPSYDLGYWSKYEDKYRIASPFYHKLHIAQLNVLYSLTGKDIFKSFADRWAKYERNFFFRNFAFIKKAIQKIME